MMADRSSIGIPTSGEARIFSGVKVAGGGFVGFGDTRT
jgi:hypothetical protein